MPKIIDNKIILDLSRIIVGPYATNVLSGFGCEVIKVEPPEGDATRLWGPPWNNGTSTYFESVNCNKKSLTLNLKKPKSKEAFYRLVEKSDVVLENFTPGIADKLEIDFERLIKYKADLIYCSVSGYGEGNYKSNQPAFDNIIQAESGFMHLTGPPESPYKMGFAISDVLTGLYTANAILAGMVHRDQTGESIHLKTSLYECSIASLINQASNHLNGGQNPQRMGNHHPNIVPYGSYPTKEGEVIICVGNPKQYQGLLEATELLTDSSYKESQHIFESNQLRVTHRQKFDQILSQKTSQLSTADLVAKLAAHNVPCGEVKDLKSVFESRLAQQLGLVKQAGATRTIRSPIRANKQVLSTQPQKEGDCILHPPYKNGQDTEQVLKNMLGLSSSEIQEIKNQSLPFI